MQDALHVFPPAGRNRPLPQVVGAARFHSSRSEALRGAHASLHAAELNLRHLAEAHPRPLPGGRPPLFHRHTP